MACRGCRKSKKEFKKIMSEEKSKRKTFQEKQLEHFMKVCPHGVPATYLCRTCDKIIEIPADAVIKPEGYINDNKKEE